jgi:hypothetical protein
MTLVRIDYTSRTAVFEPQVYFSVDHYCHHYFLKYSYFFDVYSYAWSIWVVSYHWLYPITGDDDDDDTRRLLLLLKNLKSISSLLIYVGINTRKYVDPNWRILSKPPLRRVESG